MVQDFLQQPYFLLCLSLFLLFSGVSFYLITVVFLATDITIISIVVFFLLQFLLPVNISVLILSLILLF